MILGLGVEIRCPLTKLCLLMLKVLTCWEAWVDLFSLCQPELLVCGRRIEEAAESCRLYVPAVVVQQQGCRSSCEQEELVMS